MIRFIEQAEDDNKKFARLLYNQFFIDDKWQFHGGEVAKIDGWPAKLDIENFEMYAAGADFVCFIAGGDWQQMALCSITKAYSKNQLKITPFDYHEAMTTDDIKSALERLRIAGSE